MHAREYNIITVNLFTVLILRLKTELVLMKTKKVSKFRFYKLIVFKKEKLREKIFMVSVLVFFDCVSSQTGLMRDFIKRIGITAGLI